MVYTQPRYKIAPRPEYGHPELPHKPQQQQEYTAYNQDNGSQKHGDLHESSYYSGQYPPDNLIAAQNGPARRGQETNQYGETGWNEEIRQGSDYGPLSAQPMHYEVGYGNRYAYREPRARLPPSSHFVPARGPALPPINQYQQVIPPRGAQKSGGSTNGVYHDSVSQKVLKHNDGGYQRNDRYYEPREIQGHRAQRPAIATSKSADSVGQRPRLTSEHQQQGSLKSYVNWPVQGSSGSHRPGSAPKQASTYGQQQPAISKIAIAQPPQSKERILGDLTSPDTIAWDNPFPTFPTTKKKASHTNRISLNAAVSGMTIRSGTNQEHTNEQRPSTANGKGSKNLVFSNEPKSSVQQSKDYPDEQYRNMRDVLHERNSKPYDNRHHHNAQLHENRANSGQYGALKYQHDTREEWPIPQDTHAPAMAGRRSEDANAVSSFHPSVPGSGPETQRSNTMPNNITASVSSSASTSKYSEPSWQEPGPNAGYYGPNNKEYLPKSPAKIFPSQPRPANHIKAQADIYSPIQSNPYQTHHNAHPIPHSAQDSIGDLFDSYYGASHHDQGNTDHSRGSQSQPDIDEDMPNFDAIPDLGPSHRRGMTLDEHLEPQYVPPVLPSMPSHSHGPKLQHLRMPPGPPGQVSRSRSSPNLNDQCSPQPSSYGGFDFEMSGVVPAVPKEPLPRGYDGSTIPNSNTHPRTSPQNYGQPVASPISQWPVAPASSSPNNVASAYRPPSRASQDRLQYGLHQSLTRQNVRPGAGPGRQSDNNVDSRGTATIELRPVSAPSNPDALPRHPAPIRPGLMQGSPVNQAPKPAPIRQYNNGPSPLQQANPTQPPDLLSRASVDKQRGSASVTHEELETLRQTVAKNPSDQKMQLILAKKMVEAASVLVDRRADQRTKAKTRERYILDAHKTVKKLVSNGYSDASFYLADCYSRGFLGLETDPKEAFNLYQSAAKAGHSQGAYRVAVCCEMGQEEGGGTKRDPLKAMQWYKRAATLGDPPAMYKMGIIQLKGLLGQPKNLNQAVTWLKRAADQADEENPHALHELGLLHEKDTGNEGVIKDEIYSKQLFTQAAKLGYKFSQFRLGCAYEYGSMGCPVDPRQSIAWYSKAAVQEEHQSELALSGWYLTGSEGVLQQSDTEAYLWARKAAQAGMAKAEYAMGYFTEVGIGAPANLEDAKRWYWRAASQNFPKARNRLEDLRKGGAKMEKSRVSRSAVNKQSEGDCVLM